MTDKKVEQEQLTQRTQRGRWLAWGAVGLSIIACAAVVGSWALLQQMKLDAVRQKDELQLQLVQLNDQWSTSQLKMRQVLTKIAEDYEHLSQTQANLQPMMALAKVGYVIQVASIKVMEGNVVVAQSLLSQAKAQVEPLNSGWATPLLTALSEDIQQLGQQQASDVSTVLNQWESLKRSLTALSVEPQLQKTETEIIPIVQQGTPTTGGSLWDAFIHALSSLIQIHYSPKPVPILGVNQLTWMKQQLLSRAALGEWSLLNQDGELYQSNVNDMLQMAEQYAVVQPSARSLLSPLHVLQNISVPAMPNALKSSTVVNSVQQNQNMNP